MSFPLRDRALALFRFGAFGALGLLLAAGCRAESPPRGPEEACARGCTLRANRCTPGECARGCNLVLDRLIEHEGRTVLDCMERQEAPCDDHAWARCATFVGVHADGGPPAPPPPPDFEDEGQGSD